MSEPLKIGTALKAAREAKGWTLQDAANKLRLMVRQVDAMETEDYASLGQPVFARGFVRNYAKLLGLDPEPLLAKMSESGTVAAEKVESEPYAPESPSKLSPVLIGALAVLLLLLAIPVGLYWWLNTGAEEGQQTPSANSAPAASSALQTPSQGLPPTQAGTEATSAQASGSTNTEATASTLSETAAVSTTAPTAPEPADAQAAAADAAAASAPQDSYQPSNDQQKSISLQFDQDAWVEIRDGNGRLIHYALNKAGSSLNLSGKPPFDFVLGNAAFVRMSYSGRPIDIRPYIGESVARFTLE